MFMYCANVRAFAPVLIGSFATLFVGIEILDTSRPDFLASAVMAAGVMSGVPTICCAARLSLTVLLPLTLRTIAPTPNAMSTTPAIRPPISRSFLMTFPPIKSLVGRLAVELSFLCGRSLAGGRARAIGAVPLRFRGRPAGALRETRGEDVSARAALPAGRRARQRGKGGRAS